MTERETIERTVVREDAVPRDDEVVHEHVVTDGSHHGDEEAGGAVAGGVGGAAVGAAVGGPVGAVVGGAIGAATGATAGAVDEASKDDEVVVEREETRRG